MNFYKYLTIYNSKCNNSIWANTEKDFLVCIKCESAENGECEYYNKTNKFCYNSKYDEEEYCKNKDTEMVESTDEFIRIAMKAKIEGRI